MCVDLMAWWVVLSHSTEVVRPLTVCSRGNLDQLVVTVGSQRFLRLEVVTVGTAWYNTHCLSLRRPDVSGWCFLTTSRTLQTNRRPRALPLSRLI